MKSVKIAAISLALFVSSVGFAEKLTLKAVKLPAVVKAAVSEGYDESRGNSDTGGISQIVVYQNSKNLSYYAIVRNLLGAKALDTAEHACEEKTLDACARLILAHSEDVKANYQPSSFPELIADMKSWEFENDFAQKVNTIEGYVLSILGADYKTFSLGYDSIADVFDLILISKDRKTVVVVSGDLGA